MQMQHFNTDAVSLSEIYCIYTKQNLSQGCQWKRFRFRFFWFQSFFKISGREMVPGIFW